MSLETNAEANGDDRQDYPWYRIIPATDALQQGDFLNSLPIIVPPIEIPERGTKPVDEPLDLETEFRSFNVVIMTQSCDLEDFNDNDSIIVCPRFNLHDAKSSKGKSLANANEWSNLVRGRIVSLHLLNKCDLEGSEFDYQVVDLSRIFSMPLGFAKNHTLAQGDRVRLLPPYREHLAQAFARQFMRVGLPLDLPRKFPG
jgi:hypothetical protein